MTEARPINPRALDWFEKRGISPELVADMGIFTAVRGEAGGGEPRPSSTGNIIVFPYIDRGVEVNAKFRGRAPEGDKLFFQRKGARKTFFNVDTIDDPAVHAGHHALVITEGEPDALTAIQCGHPFTVSVPDGAPADKDHNGNPIPMKPDHELDPGNDPKFEYVVNNWDRLKPVKRIILATDGDGPGMRLRDELARRLGRERCAFIEYPHQDKKVVPTKDRDGQMAFRPVKDLNEVLIHFGADAVREVIRTARNYPVSGLYTLDDFENQPLVTFELGFNSSLNELIQIYEGAFIVISGLPSVGKSAFANQLAHNMARNHGWPWAIASFEARVKPFVRDQLRGYLLRTPKSGWNAFDRERADNFIRSRFCFINRVGGRIVDGNMADDDATVEWLIGRAEAAVVRYGIKGVLIDPWNEIDHTRKGGESIADYTNRAIRLLKDFAARYGVCVIVVAHPTKEAGKAVKEGSAMTLYDIADGATWANKAEFGIIVHRGNEKNTATQIYVRKVKHHRITGRVGDALLQYDPDVEQFVA